MSYDLRRELAELGAQEQAAADALPVDLLHSRARRRRTARAAVASSAALAVVAVVAAVAAALPSSEPLPPAHTPTPTLPAPTPEPESEPLPEWAPGTTFDGSVPECGDTVPDVLAAGADDERTPISVTVDEPTLSGRWNEAVTVSVTITGPADEPMWSRGPALVVARDGVVVGGSAAEGTGFVYEVANGAAWPDTVLALTDCAGDPLPVGEYALYPVAELVRIDPATLDFAPDTLTVVSEPVTLTVQALDRAALDALVQRDGPGRLVVTTAGIGPLTVGLPPETNPGRALIYPVPGYCRMLRESMGERYDPMYDGTDWFPAGYDSRGDWRELPFAVAASGGSVTRIDVQSDRLATSEGIRIGSPLAELRAAHPEAVNVTDFPHFTELWIIQDERGTLAFEVAVRDETENGTVVDLTDPVVGLMRIYSRNVDDWVGRIDRTGDGVYNCFGT